jgi:hypothetical protein
LFAQDKERKNAITANGGAIIGLSNLTYERAIGKKVSVLISPSFSYLREEKVKYITGGIGGGFRYYLLKNKPVLQGLYISPVFSFATGAATIETTGRKADIIGYSVQSFGGYQWIMKKGLTINVGGGLQYLRLDYKTDKELNITSKLAYSGILQG